MKLGRLEFFITRNEDGTVHWRSFEYNYGCCKCHIFTLGPVGFTWLSDECITSSEECK